MASKSFLSHYFSIQKNDQISSAILFVLLLKINYEFNLVNSFWCTTLMSVISLERVDNIFELALQRHHSAFKSDHTSLAREREIELNSMVG